MKRTYSLIVVFALILSSAYSQNSLTGVVKDKVSGGVLAGATLYFSDLMKGSISNSDGNYQIANLPSGSFLLEVKFLGYRSWVGKVQVMGNTTLNLDLQPAAAEIREVIITGTSASVDRRLNPISSIVVNKDDLLMSNSSNPMDAISRRPGISQVTTGNGISKPVIRGLGYNRVVTLNDGIRQEDQQWGDEHGVELDAESVNRVEVIKGPGSILYGSDAIAGVINFLNILPPEAGSIRTELVGDYQTNSHSRGFSLLNQANTGKVNWMFRLSGKQAGNYQNSSDGYVYNSGFKELNTNGYIGINRKWGYSQLQYSLFSQSVGLVEGDRDSLGRFIKPVPDENGDLQEAAATEQDLESYGIDTPWQKLNHRKLVWSSNVILGNSRIALKIGYQQNQRSELADPLNPDVATLFLKLNTSTYDLKYFLKEMNGWETSFGIGGMLQSNIDGGEEFLIPEYELSDIGVFAYTRKKTGKFLISGGARLDKRHLESSEMKLADEMKFTGFTRDFSSLSGSAGVSYEISDVWVLKANLSRGFRAPNIAELASNGKHEGTYRYELGNSDLKPENSFQMDAGFSFNKMHVSLEADLFYNRISNYIFTQKLSSLLGGDSIPDPADPVPAFNFVQGDATLFGGELILDIHPHPIDWIHFENSLSFVRGQQLNVADSMSNLPMIPQPTVNSTIRLDLPGLPFWLQRFYVYAGMEYHLKQDNYYAAYGTETSSPAYMLLNAGAGLDFCNSKKVKLFTLVINGSNLTDVAYQDHLSRLRFAPENPLNGKTGVFNMGRNVGFKIIVPVSWKIKSLESGN